MKVDTRGFGNLQVTGDRGEGGECGMGVTKVYWNAPSEDER